VVGEAHFHPPGWYCPMLSVSTALVYLSGPGTSEIANKAAGLSL